MKFLHDWILSLYTQPNGCEISRFVTFETPTFPVECNVWRLALEKLVIHSLLMYEWACNDVQNSEIARYYITTAESRRFNKSSRRIKTVWTMSANGSLMQRYYTESIFWSMLSFPNQTWSRLIDVFFGGANEIKCRLTTLAGKIIFLSASQL